MFPFCSAAGGRLAYTAALFVSPAKSSSDLGGIALQCFVLRCLNPPVALRAFSRSTRIQQTATVNLTPNITYQAKEASSPINAKTGIRETPSEALISALRDRGCGVGIPKPASHFTDLSWVDPAKLSTGKGRAGSRTSKENGGHTRLKGKARLSYATIVANYIRHLDPLVPAYLHPTRNAAQNPQTFNTSLLRVFDDDTLNYLSQRGYSASDVMIWAWILLSPRAAIAAMRLSLVKKRSFGTRDNSNDRLPLFLLMFILRRDDINLKALNLLLTETRAMLFDSPPEEPELQKRADMVASSQPAWSRSGDDNTVMILFVRLIRAARQVSPKSIEDISQMFTALFGSRAVGSTLNDKRAQRLTNYYNKILSLLAIPCQKNPYASTIIQQRSIFHLLREMTNFTPPIAVTREGYQAVTRVQSARQKLPAEREWADFKAKSWPPWKEAKLGIDVDRGLEGSKSRTIGSIQRMKEAGYSATRWDRIATILAGWDLDGTPTIQTRSFPPKPSPFRMRDEHTTWLGSDTITNKPDLFLGLKPEDRYHDTWAARIRATRTMKEAWACFLSCRDQGLRITSDVYLELAEKVVYYEYLQNPSQSRSIEALPGDGKEVHPEPSSPRDVMYVHSEPPTLDALLQHMFALRIKLSRKLLVLLLNHLTSFESGVECISKSVLLQSQVEALTVSWAQNQLTREKQLAGIPNDVFAAFIGFLCRVSGPTGSLGGNPSLSLSEIFPIARPARDRKSHQNQGKVTAAGSLAHAVYLVRLRQPRYLPTWNHLLAALGGKRLSPGSPHVPLVTQRILAWRETRDVLRWMEHQHLDIDANGFLSVCNTLSTFLRAARNSKGGVALNMGPSMVAHNVLDSTTWTSSSISTMATEGVNLVKQKFDAMTLSRNGPLFCSVSEKSTVPTFPYSSSPTMFTVPNPSTLHALIRVLGLAADFDSLIILLRWMAENATDLERTMEQHLGGRRAMRRAVVAARVYLEKNSVSLEELPLIPLPSEGQSFESDLKKTSSVDPSTSRPPIDKYFEEAYDIIESSGLLSPWPSNDEVDAYVADHKGTLY